MAKNLKLNVKNSQFAEAIKLNRLKATEEEEEKKKPKKKPAAAQKKARSTDQETESSTKPDQKEIPKEAAKSPVPPTEEKAKPKKPAEAPTSDKKSAKKKDSAEPKSKKPKFSPLQYKDFKQYKPSNRRPSFDSRDRKGLRGDQDRWRRRRSKGKNHSRDPIPVVRPTSLKVKIPISVKDLAAEMKIKASELIGKLLMHGIAPTINDYLEDETTIQLIGHEFGCNIEIDTSEEERLRITEHTIKEEIKDTSSDVLKPRPPVVTFMGHVDHGKTSLIDSIRKSRLAETESGKITQHIGAFRAHGEHGEITILDTPGHEAFTEMRYRGVIITDIVVLVIAGDEGIKPQTLEAIERVKETGVPIIVAINKSDKPGFNPETVFRQLADHELVPEAWGGSTITVNCSAKTGEGIETLVEMLGLQAEISELKANPCERARGTVIESQLHKGFGAVATVLVQNGTLKKGDSLVFEEIYGRVKTMHDEHNRTLEEAGPSTPVKITGISGIPAAGCEFIVVESEKEARALTQERTIAGKKRANLKKGKPLELDVLMQRQTELSEKKTLNLILKADVQGSIEAMTNSLKKLPSNKVELYFVASSVGEISESDVELALASNAVIIGFHTRVESHAESLLKQTKVKVLLHEIIYHLIDDVKELMTALLDKIRQENEVGTALVKATFKASQLGLIAGCQVTDGLIKRNHLAKIIRNNEQVWEGNIASLKRLQEDVREVAKGLECGILLENNNEILVDDVIKTYEVTYIQQEL